MHEDIFVTEDLFPDWKRARLAQIPLYKKMKKYHWNVHFIGKKLVYSNPINRAASPSYQLHAPIPHQLHGLIATPSSRLLTIPRPSPAHPNISPPLSSPCKRKKKTSPTRQHVADPLLYGPSYCDHAPESCKPLHLIITPLPISSTTSPISAYPS